MPTCPKCGSRSAKYELRSAGTKSRTKYYRNGIKHSLFFSVGHRDYSSNRMHKAVGFCPECGYVWDKLGANNGCLLPILTVVFGFAFFLGLGEGVIYLWDALYSFGFVESSQTPNWVFYVSFALAVFIGIFVIWKIKQHSQKKKNMIKTPKSYISTHSQISAQPVKTQSVQKQMTYILNGFETLDVHGLSDDELIPYAAEIFLQTNTVSVSMLQRNLKLGYARAARLIDMMEEKGFVGPFQGEKPRALLITQSQLDDYKSRQNC